MQAYKGTFLAAGGHTRQSGIESLESNHADLIVYGRHFLANPDLPRRFELDAPLNEYDRDSFYSADLKKVRALLGSECALRPCSWQLLCTATSQHLVRSCSRVCGEGADVIAGAGAGARMLPDYTM